MPEADLLMHGFQDRDANLYAQTPKQEKAKKKKEKKK
jgi:hypothetical protein